MAAMKMMKQISAPMNAPRSIRWPGEGPSRFPPSRPRPPVVACPGHGTGSIGLLTVGRP